MIPLETLLATRYSPPAWAFLREVPDGTGFAKSRTADAIAMSLWPSRGLDLHGFEMKKSRGDWLKELKNPKKAEAFVGFCDYWWIVAEKDVVKPAELPSTWGLLVRAGKTLRAKHEAPKLDADPPDRAFLASVFRQISTLKDKYVLKTEIDKELREQFREGLDRGKEIGKHEVERDRKELDQREVQIKEFERASGLKIPRWNGGADLGAAVKLVQASQNDQHARRVERMASSLEDTVLELRGVLKDWRESPVIDELTLVKAAFCRLSDTIDMAGLPDENRLEYLIRRKTWDMLEASGVDTSVSNFHQARKFLGTWKDPKDESK